MHRTAARKGLLRPLPPMDLPFLVLVLTLVGFGSFYVGERAERTGRNPKTGETITIPAAKSPKFRAGKTLKDAL